MKFSTNHNTRIIENVSFEIFHVRDASHFLIFQVPNQLNQQVKPRRQQKLNNGKQTLYE
jgi:hypothetical protein